MGNSSSSKPGAIPKDVTQLDSNDYISIGSSGGFTGPSSEVYLYGDGSVAYRTTHVPCTATVTTKTGKIDMETVQNLFQLFTGSIIRTEHRHIRNMTTYISYRRNSIIHNWCFEYLSPPPFLELIYDTFVAATAEDKVQ